MGFATESVPAYGVPIAAAPGIRRVVARNPGPLTYHGTNSWIVEGEDTSVIDPGPDDPGHLASLHAAAGPVARILLTHSHPDHARGAAAFRRMTGAPLMGWGKPWDPDLRVDAALAEGDAAGGLRVLHTPGHASDHLCFAHATGLFTGDHVMGWSTSVIAPPDGDMGAYLASLRRLIGRGDPVYFPGHGPPFAQPERLVRGMISHRLQREAAVLAAVASPCAPADIVARLYPGLDAGLRRAAEASVLAHLLKLEREGRVAREADRFRAA